MRTEARGADALRTEQHLAFRTPDSTEASHAACTTVHTRLARRLEGGVPPGSRRFNSQACFLITQSPARACASWRSQDIVCPGVSPGGSNGTDSRKVANSAALPRRCVAVAPRRRGSAALPATSRVRSVQEPGSASPCMQALQTSLACKPRMQASHASELEGRRRIPQPIARNHSEAFQ